VRGVRWQSLFDDLEAQLDAAVAAELAGEVAERSRLEAGRIRLSDRLAEAAGAAVAVSLPGVGAVRGRVLDAGIDWLLLDEGAGREALVPLDAVLGISGVGARTAVPGAEGEVGKRLDLRWALRGLARAGSASRSPCATGPPSRHPGPGGGDHVDLAEHAPGEARRAGAVRAVRLVPLAAVALVRSG
jgi:hypothetical protein